MFIASPIPGDLYRGDAIFFSLEIAIDREVTVDYLCKKIVEILVKLREDIIKKLWIPRINLKELQLLGLVPEADGQITLGITV